MTWIARKPLKRPEWDEGIQENTSLVSWSGLDWLWCGLEEFGPRRYSVGRSLLRASRREWTKPVAGDGVRSALVVTQFAVFGAQAFEIACALAVFAGGRAGLESGAEVTAHWASADRSGQVGAGNQCVPPRFADRADARRTAEERQCGFSTSIAIHLPTASTPRFAQPP